MKDNIINLNRVKASKLFKEALTIIIYDKELADYKMNQSFMLDLIHFKSLGLIEDSYYNEAYPQLRNKLDKYGNND